MKEVLIISIPKTKKIVLRVVNIAVVVGFGVFLLYYLLNQIDIGDIKEAFINIYKLSLIIGLILMFSIDFFRAYRAKFLIGPSRIRMCDMFLVFLRVLLQIKYKYICCYIELQLQNAAYLKLDSGAIMNILMLE